MASPMSESQQWRVDDVDEHHRHDDDVIDYCPLTRGSPKPSSAKLLSNQDYDESVTPDSSSVESESPRVATVGQQWDEEHRAETSSHSGHSQDDELPASWSRAPLKPTSRSGNGELRTPTLSSVTSGRSLKPKAVEVDQSVELPLYIRGPIEPRSSGVASTSVRCTSASTTDVGRAKGEKNSFYRLPNDTTSGRVSVSTPFLEMSSHSREPMCDENGNPVESSRGASPYYPAAKNNHETFGSSVLHRMAERDRDEQPGRRPDKDSARLLEKIKKRRTKFKDNKSILAQEIPGHRGDRARPVEELLSYINGTKQPVEAAVVTNGDSKLEKKMKRAGEKGKKSGHEAVSGKVCDSKPVGKLSSSSKHTCVPDGEVVGDNKAAVNVSHGTATCNSWAFPLDEERLYNTSDVASYSSVTFADVGSNDVNVSSIVTTCETFSVDLVAEVPTSKQEDRLVVSSVQKEPPSAATAPLHFEAWDAPRQSDHLPDVVQSSESFLTVIKKKKSKDIVNPARCTAVGTHRPSVAGYPQVGNRHHGAPMEHMSRAAPPSKDVALELHDAKGCHDLLALPKDATEVLSANGFRDVAVDFPPMRPLDRHGECAAIGGTAAAGVDIHATLYAGVAEDSSHKRTWAKVASKPANPLPVDRVHHEPDRELQLKQQLHDVGLTDGQLCGAAGPSAVCQPLCVEGAGAQSVCRKPEGELKPEQPRLPAVSMPITSMTVLPMADVVFGYSPDLLCDNPVPTKVTAATAGSYCVPDRPPRGVEFCSSMMYASTAPFTISFGCEDILDESEPLAGGLQFGDLQQQDGCCSVAVDSVRLAGAQSDDVPPTHDILATSPMVEGPIGATQMYAVHDYEQPPHARAIQFLTKEYAAVLELLHKSSNRVVVYADSEDGICIPHT